MKRLSDTNRSNWTGHLLLMVLFCALLAGCASESTGKPVRVNGQTMGTYYDIQFVELPEGESPDSMQKIIEAELDRINDLMSTWKDDSQLMQFNNSESEDWFKVDADTEFVVRKAIEISELTGGTFDVTVGPLVELWNFGASKHDFKVPDEESLNAVSEEIGWQLVETREEEPALKKKHPKVFLNLSAIAKGFAVDQVADVLREAGVASYLVNIGGEMVASGKKANGEPWTVAIEQPSETAIASPKVLKAIPLRDGALATSGNYRNYFEDADGNRYSHTIDPRTLRPVKHHLLSASVLAENCTEADGFATALMVMGPKEARQFSIDHDLAIYLVYKEDEDGPQQEWASPLFEKYESGKDSVPGSGKK